MTTKTIFPIHVWLIFIVIFLFACTVNNSNKNRGMYRTQNPVCIDWATIPLGEYEINNNVWGKGKIRDYSQCIFKGAKTESGNPINMGWSWDWPGKTVGVKSYPSILYGRKPWNGYSTTPYLPKKIGQLKNLTVSYSVKTSSSGAVNLLLESWITSTSRARPQDRLGELAIQLYQNNWPGQAGEFVNTVTIDGISFDFYLNPKMRVPGDHHTWVYYGFVHKGEPILQAKLNMMDFVNYLINHGYLDQNSYLTSVELGNEVDRGKGTTILEHFSVKGAGI